MSDCVYDMCVSVFSMCICMCVCVHILYMCMCVCVCLCIYASVYICGFHTSQQYVRW